MVVSQKHSEHGKAGEQENKDELDSIVSSETSDTVVSGTESCCGGDSPPPRSILRKQSSFDHDFRSSRMSSTENIVCDGGNCVACGESTLEEVRSTSPETMHCLTSKDSKVLRVRFEKSSKTWDGPSEENVYFDRIVFQYFNGQGFRNEQQLHLIVPNISQQLLKRVSDKVSDLIRRVHTRLRLYNETAETLVIASGGGHGTRVGKIHLPWLIKMKANIDALYTKILNSGDTVAPFVQPPPVNRKEMRAG